MPKSVFSLAYEQFRARLVHARTDAGLTQIDVAALLQRPQSYVSKYENGERRLDVIEFLEIAQVLQIDVAATLQDLQQYLPNRT
jgi:transcriptional regulator with XRE-family HTH domain